MRHAAIRLEAAAGDGRTEHADHDQHDPHRTGAASLLRDFWG
jgi:hypothetical protein